MIKFYGYDKCGTCRNAKKYLLSKKVKFDDIDITKNPPKKTQIQAILKSGDYELKDLFNKSGVLYREMNMKEKMKSLKDSQLIDLLAKHGKLVKRPIVTDGKRFSVGYKEEIFHKIWK